jgi:hypothetical protein
VLSRADFEALLSVRPEEASDEMVGRQGHRIIAGLKLEVFEGAPSASVRRLVLDLEGSLTAAAVAEEKEKEKEEER